MTEFKQIIGRGTRVRDDYGKLYFNILDYTGAATRMFNDPEFDGDPASVVDVDINDEGEPISVTVAQEEEIPVVQLDNDAEPEQPGPIQLIDTTNSPPRKYYIDNQLVEIAGTVVFDLDAEGRRLRTVRLTEYAGSKVKTIWRDADELKEAWTDLDRRAVLIAELEKRGIELSDLANAASQPDADPFDLLCHLAFQSPLRTRKDRAARLKEHPETFLGKYGKEAREILTVLLDKYAVHGTDQFSIPDILEVPPISEYGNVMEIANYFGGPEQLRTAVNQMQQVLYAA